jgi:hypothetical protein
MRDIDVRDALRRRLHQEHASELPDTLFVDELGLCGQVRVDVAVVNGVLSGYELKSASDTLRRLPTQVEIYSQVLDHATLVVADNHADHARAMLPSWWGVIEATWTGVDVELRNVTPPQMNPGIQAYSLAQLLWRDEVLDELTQRGLEVGYRSKPRLILWQRLAAEVPLDELRQVVRARLKAREGWRAARKRP